MNKLICSNRSRDKHLGCDYITSTDLENIIDCVPDDLLCPDCGSFMIFVERSKFINVLLNLKKENNKSNTGE